MSEELKPCPFCEQDAELKINYPAVGIGMHGAYVRCNNCGAESAFDLGESGAIESWNNRPIEDALRAELETMRGLCKTLEVNLSGQNDTVEEMHGEVMRLKDALGLFLEYCDTPDIPVDGETYCELSLILHQKFVKAEEAARAALESKP